MYITLYIDIHRYLEIHTYMYIYLCKYRSISNLGALFVTCLRSCRLLAKDPSAGTSVWSRHDVFGLHPQVTWQTLASRINVPSMAKAVSFCCTFCVHTCLVPITNVHQIFRTGLHIPFCEIFG